MRRILCPSLLIVLVLSVLPDATPVRAQTPLPLTREQVASLPPPVARPVDFVRDIKPILQNSCVKCHGRGRNKGGFSLETRAALMDGGDNGPAVTPGVSETSHLIALVAGMDPDNVMPQKGSRLKPEQIGLLRAWIDQGAAWDASVTFAKSEPKNIEPRQPVLPDMPAPEPALAVSHAQTVSDANPIDRLLASYFAEHQIAAGAVVDDRVYARRVYLDTIGLLPTPDALRTFIADTRPDKRARLVEQLLADRTRYAEHWLSFWNDALRNDYRGTGFIDGGREQISTWLYTALVRNLPYDKFVAQLINPSPGVTGAEGFTKGIIWRGVVNASQTPPMQAAQNVSQVFMGVNLKCASCHDSFINDWQLADAYGLAGIYADAPLEMVECDRPTGRTAQAKFLYAKLGSIDAKAARAARLQQLSDVITGPKNGRLSRTIVNRLWAKFMGRGLVEPVDDMEQTAWNPDLLDWLAEDLVAHGYDLKHTMARILTSRAYQLPAVDLPDSAASSPGSAPPVFRGPGIRRMSAEQFADALSTVTGVWQGLPAGEFDFTVAPDRAIPAPRGQWIWNTARTTPIAATRAEARTRAARTAGAHVAITAAPGASRAIVAAAAAPAKGRVPSPAAAAAPTGARATATRDSERVPDAIAFRKTIDLASAPYAAQWLVAYDGPFVLFVNGTRVGEVGSGNAKPRLFDVKSALHAGRNVLALAVARPKPEEPKPAAAPGPPASANGSAPASGAAPRAQPASTSDPGSAPLPAAASAQNGPRAASPSGPAAAATAADAAQVASSAPRAAPAFGASPPGLFMQLLVRRSGDETSTLEVAAISDATWQWRAVAMPVSASSAAAAASPDLKRPPAWACVGVAPQALGASGAHVAAGARQASAASHAESARNAAAGAARAPGNVSPLAANADAGSASGATADAGCINVAATQAADRAQRWMPAIARGAADIVPEPLLRALDRAVATANLDGRARASLVAGDPMTIALGRPNREQVVTTRATVATTLQALELSNGQTLTSTLKRGAARLLADHPTRDVLIDRIYQRALGRAPTAAEAEACAALLDAPPAVPASARARATAPELASRAAAPAAHVVRASHGNTRPTTGAATSVGAGSKSRSTARRGAGAAAALRPEGVQDLLWAVAMLPEFQLIY